MNKLQAYFKRYFHCLFGTLSGHQMEDEWGNNYLTNQKWVTRIGCSCGKTFY